MSSYLQKAQLLIDHGRFAQAERELRQALLFSPNDAIAHCLLAVCLAEQRLFGQAREEAALAIRLDPGLSYVHYILASVLYDEGDNAEAMEALRRAIAIDPEIPDYFALQAGILFARKNWAEALAAADQALKIDAEHINASNLRAMCLMRLGREQEAQQSVEAALRRDPENAGSHANQGWTLLHRGDHARALIHFREALRINPELGWAREGILEALKSRYLIYRLLLRYFFWISKLSDRAQWAFVLGAYIVYRILAAVASEYPQLAPWLWPLLGAYIGFVLLTWIGDPIFNLLLRANKFGRLILSKEQKRAATLVALCLLSGASLLLASIATGSELMLQFAIGTSIFAFPIAGVFKLPSGSGRQKLAVYTGFLALIAAAWFGLSIAADPAAEVLGWLYFLGIFLFSWLANYLIMRE